MAFQQMVFFCRAVGISCKSALRHDVKRQKCESIIWFKLSSTKENKKEDMKQRVTSRNYMQLVCDGIRRRLDLVTSDPLILICCKTKCHHVHTLLRLCRDRMIELCRLLYDNACFRCAQWLPRPCVVMPHTTTIWPRSSRTHVLAALTCKQCPCQHSSKKIRWIGMGFADDSHICSPSLGGIQLH